MSCRFIIVGDVHYGKMLNAGRPGSGIRLNSRVAEVVTLLEFILEQAVEARVQDIFITGDICEDVKPDHKYIQLFSEWLVKCKDHGITVYVVAGNHDMSRVGQEFYSALDTLHTLKHLKFYKDFSVVTLDGVSVLLIPYRDREWLRCMDYNAALEMVKREIQYHVSAMPDDHYRIAIGHLALEGAIYTGEDDSLTNQITCALDWFDGFDYTWMGHVHKYQILKEDPLVAHIGSLTISDFCELGNEKFIVVFDDSKMPQYSIMPLPVRQLRKVVITVPTVDDATKYVVEQLEVMHDGLSFNNQVIRVEIRLNDDASTIDRDVIEKTIYGFGAHYIANCSESRVTTVINLDTVDTVDNAIKPEDAVQIFAQANEFEDPEVKDLYIRYSLDIIEEFKGKE